MIIKNNDINFSNYYNILEFLGNTLAEHPSIKSVSQGPIPNIDSYEFPAYPFANIMITNIYIVDNTTNYQINLIIGDKVKDLNNLSEENQPQIINFYGTDDEVDVFANTSQILNDVLAFIDRGTTAFNIDGTITMTPFSDSHRNGISGFAADFNLITFNNRKIC